MLYGEMLLYAGGGVVLLSLIGGAIAATVTHSRKKKLEGELNDEYGIKHH